MKIGTALAQMMGEWFSAREMTVFRRVGEILDSTWSDAVLDAFIRDGCYDAGIDRESIGHLAGRHVALMMCAALARVS